MRARRVYAVKGGIKSRRVYAVKGVYEFKGNI